MNNEVKKESKGERQSITIPHHALRDLGIALAQTIQSRADQARAGKRDFGDFVFHFRGDI